MSRLLFNKRDGAGHPLSRRAFLITAGGGALAFGFAGQSVAAISLPQSGDTPPVPKGVQFAPDIWYAIDSEGTVTINIARAEMGQHVGTALARIVADELEADWSRVRIIYVDSNLKWGLMFTGASWSVWQSFPVLSRAGAAGRIGLIEAGAKLMGVAPGDCSARNSRVTAGERSIGYGEIVQRGGITRKFSPEEMKKLPIKPASQRRLIGREVKDLDIPQKVNGSALYGIDARVPGMVYARPKVPPTRYDSKVVSVDDSAAQAVRGYLRSITLDDPSSTVPGWVMVIAESFHAAIRAADLVKVTWSSGPSAKVSEKDLLDHAATLIASSDKGTELYVDNDDSPAGNTTEPATTIQHDYSTGTVLHFQLEPVNALACEKDGIFEIHTGTQAQSLALPVLAKALGRPQSSIVMYTYFLGGGFGRRLDSDYPVPAALAAKALGRPVKMILTREDDARFDCVRSPSLQRLHMGFGSDGSVQSMAHAACAGWPTKVMAPSYLEKGKNGLYDPFSISGADHWYDVGRQTVRAIDNDLVDQTFRPGWLRSVGPGWVDWAVESFMDEAARHVGSDPVDFRLKLLNGKGRNAGQAPNSVGGAHRQAAVARLAAERGGWGAPMPKDTGLGFATTFGQERDMPTWLGCVARVHVDRATGAVRAEKLTVVVDAGTRVDPDGALAQVQGAVLWGLSMALHEGTEFVNGQVRDTNLDTYMPLRMNDMPELDISFIDSTEVPVGLGEPGTTVVAPAIANAIFAAVGVRLRHIPITPQAVIGALNAT